MTSKTNNKETNAQTFISYLDDDNTQKNQWVIVIEKNKVGIKFTFSNNLTKIIFIPWSRVIKIKEDIKKND